jgi:hypothetical protein
VKAPRLLVVLVGCLLGGAIVVPTALAAPAAAPLRVSIAIPTRVTSGEEAFATGKVTPAARRGRVQLQERAAGRWKALATGAIRQGRFRIGFVLDGTEAASVRAVLLAGDRAVAASPARRVGVMKAAAPTPSPAPPVTGTQPTPSPPSEVPTTPPTEAPTVPPKETPTTPPVEAPTEPPVGEPPTEPPVEPPVEEPPSEPPEEPPAEEPPVEEPPVEEPPVEEPPVEEPPAEEPPVEEPEEPPAVTDAYWGAWIGPQFTGTAAPEDMGAVTDFEALAGKPLSLLETFGQWAQCSGASPTCQATVAFPRAKFETMRGYGAIPLYSWASEGDGEPNAQPEFQLADIIAGKFDPYIRRWATEAKAWGHPFFLRFDWEMNGNWFPWAEGVDGNQAGEYAAAWRHVNQIFSEVGATNASWVWCPYVNPNGNLLSPATLYPGDEYVDWTCLDGYNRGTTASPTAAYRSFDYLFGPNYREITGTVAPSKPMLLAEVAASEHGGSKAKWIEEMFAELPSAYPQVRGLMWFDYYDQGNDWPIETSTAATEAFATGIGNALYLTNTFAATGSGPVPLP